MREVLIELLKALGIIGLVAGTGLVFGLGFWMAGSLFAHKHIHTVQVASIRNTPDKEERL